MIAGEQAPVIDARGRKRGIKQWVVCPVCDNGRWVRIDALRLYNFTGMCSKCHNKFTTGKREKHGRWVGGVISSGKTYKYVRVAPDDYFYPMAVHSHGYVSEHRLVIAKDIGRLLEPWEIVHHLNGDKKDNRLENLQLTLPDKHNANHRLLMVIKRQKAKIRQLQDIINRQPSLNL
ncbi:MAG: HNH endonuclease [Smithella sp.]